MDCSYNSYKTIQFEPKFASLRVYLNAVFFIYCSATMEPEFWWSRIGIEIYLPIDPYYVYFIFLKIKNLENISWKFEAWLFWNKNPINPWIITTDRVRYDPNEKLVKVRIFQKQYSMKSPKEYLARLNFPDNFSLIFWRIDMMKKIPFKMFWPLSGSKKRKELKLKFREKDTQFEKISHFFTKRQNRVGDFFQLYM